MEFQELKQKSKLTVLLNGKSGRGKTRAACKAALAVSSRGGDVKYVDTENEGATNLVALVEGGYFEEDDVENIVYQQIDSYDDMENAIETGSEYDLFILDTLDSKHQYALQEVNDEMIDRSDTDWNQYLRAYDMEIRLMRELRKVDANVIGCLDPESGDKDKPKGAQTNVHGFFNVVVDLKDTIEDDGDTKWPGRFRNYVGRSDKIGKTVANWDDVVVQDLVKRTEGVQWES